MGALHLPGVLNFAMASVNASACFSARPVGLGRDASAASMLPILSWSRLAGLQGCGCFSPCHFAAKLDLVHLLLLLEHTTADRVIRTSFSAISIV